MISSSSYRNVLVGLLVLMAPSQPSSAATNLLANPGFESGFTGWTTFDNAFISEATTDNIFRTGGAAGKVFGFGGGAGPSGFLQSFSPTSGQVYELSGFGYVSSLDPIPSASNDCAGNRCTAKIAFFDSAFGGTELSSNEYVVADINTPHDVWTPFTVSAPVPAGAQRVEALILFIQPGMDPGAAFLDDLSFCENSPPPFSPNVLADPGFDSGLLQWSAFENVAEETRTGLVRRPPGSAKVYGYSFAPPSGIYQTFATGPGEVWRLESWSLSTCRLVDIGEPPIQAGSASFVVAKIVFRDAGFVEIGSGEVIIADATTPRETWIEHSVEATAPAGAVTAEAYVIYVPLEPNAEGNVWVDDVVFFKTVGISAPLVSTPSDLELRQNVPNPFRQVTRIDFTLAGPTSVQLRVYDVTGRLVRVLADGNLGDGVHSVQWNGTTRDGIQAASGTYRYVLDTRDGRVSKKMMLLR